MSKSTNPKISKAKKKAIPIKRKRQSKAAKENISKNDELFTKSPHYITPQQLEGKIIEAVRKDGMYKTYLEAASDVMVELGLEADFFETLLTPVIKRLIKEDAIEYNFRKK